MLEAFQSLREELTSKKQVEVDQTSTSKPETSHPLRVNLGVLQILIKWKWAMALHFLLISVLIII